MAPAPAPLFRRTLSIAGILAELAAVILAAGVMAGFVVAFARATHLVAWGVGEGALAVAVLTAPLVILLTTWRARAAFGDAWRESIGVRRPDGLRPALLVLALALCVGGQIVWLTVLSGWSGVPIALSVPAGSARAPYAVWAVVLAPLGEEMLFRGLLDSRLRLAVPSALAYVAVAALFVATHADGGWARPLSVLPLALTLGWLRRSSASLWPGVALHMLNNAAILLHSLAR